VYRTLKEVYLLASDWLLKHGEVADMGEVERRRLNFHSRQFVNATARAWHTPHTAGTSVTLT
jgi:polyhydroxyalkanoate synthase subunit PhaC